MDRKTLTDAEQKAKDKSARMKAALRANLQKRKAQGRARTNAEKPLED